MAAHQAPPSLGFSRQEHWRGLPFPSPVQESGKWKWSRSVVSDSSRPHGLQPTRLLCPWDFPGKSTGVGCYFSIYKIPFAQGNFLFPLYQNVLVGLSFTKPLSPSWGKLATQIWPIRDFLGLVYADQGKRSPFPLWIAKQKWNKLLTSITTTCGEKEYPLASVGNGVIYSPMNQKNVWRL